MEATQKTRGYSIGVIGLWHLGCVIAASWAKLGARVYGFDYDSARVAELNKGTPPIFEPGLEEQVKAGLKANLLSFSDSVASLSQADFIFLSYDTPVLDDDTCDTSILAKSIEDVRAHMKNGATLIVSSQSPVGFSRRLLWKLKERNSSLRLAYSPENLRLGNALNNYANPGRVILGAPDSETLTACKELFRPIPCDIITMNLESAEIVKHGINAFLGTCIVFGNSLSDICEETGGCMDDVLNGMRSDPRIGKDAYIAPGTGFSGGTLGRDLKILEGVSQEMEGTSSLFGMIHALNSKRTFTLLNNIETLASGLKGKTIGLLGITYKAGTSTLRRSLPLDVAKLLLSKGANVNVYDPKANYAELEKDVTINICNNITQAARNADALVLLTEWPEFREFNWESLPQEMKNPLFYDTKNFLSQSSMKSAGFLYYSMGRDKISPAMETTHTR